MADRTRTTGALARPALPPEGEHDFLTCHPFDITTHRLPRDVLVEQAAVPMRDGVRLAATVFRPDAGPRVPVITTATPYGKDRFDQWNYFRDAPEGSVPGGGGFYLGRLEFSDHTAFEAPDPGFWVPSGYAVVLVDLPGRGKSESNPSGTPGPEARWWDVMAWLEQQPWCTGKVGMSGVSALCATQWIAAKDEAPPQLKAIIPWEGINETGPGGGYGGIRETAFGPWLESQWHQPNINPDAAGPEPYIADWKFDTSAIIIPALVCASFSDQELHTWDTFDAFTRIRSPHKWLYNHRRQKWAAYYGAEELALQKRFLDRFLKGDEHAMDGVPPVRLEVNTDRFDHKVVHATSWPVEGTRYNSLYLRAGSATMAVEPTPIAAGTSIAPAPVGDPDNRAVFDHCFQEDTDVVGHMALTLFVDAVGSDDVDLFVGVEKLDHHGDKVYFFSASGGNANGPVSRGWLRASRRELNTERSTPWRPVPSLATGSPLSPGQIVETNIPVMPSGTTFLAGETLRLIVQSWSAPGEFEGGETRQWDSITTGRCRLHTGGQHPSRLLIPIVS
ncbi:CocE/NonD family hydrolase [Streptomyces inhibens]|uniref:CocE/NonD family hydrolase n=1 Tax=Streptomyces inhibens TaxID=2293571 RepID=UPI0037BE1AC9